MIDSGTGPMTEGGAGDSSSGTGGTCPAAQSFFTDLGQAQCAAASCCAEYTSCQMSPDCILIATCFSQCLGGGIGQGTPDTCSMQCEVDASATGSATFDSAFACFRLNCLTLGGGDDAGSD
jgi:hypothetical protein